VSKAHNFDWWQKSVIYDRCFGRQQAACVLNCIMCCSMSAADKSAITVAAFFMSYNKIYWCSDLLGNVSLCWLMFDQQKFCLVYCFFISQMNGLKAVMVSTKNFVGQPIGSVCQPDLPATNWPVWTACRLRRT